MKAPIRVAVGVLQDAERRVLVAERDPARHQGGRLEFPGGKCEPGESGADALRRELREEIGVEIVAPSPLIRVHHDYGDRTVELETFLVEQWRGVPQGVEGQPIEWVAPAALDPQRLPAANRPILAALTLPATCLITPDIDQLPAPDDVIAGVEAALRHHVGWVQLRRADEGSRAWWELVRELSERCRVTGARLLVNAAPERAAALPPGTGLHLRARAVAGLASRPVPAGVPLSCACHDTDELRAAERLHAEFALLGPVRATPTHPGRPGLGWEGFAALAATTPLPLYALGGVGPSDLAQARDAGAVGVAGIRSFRCTAKEGGGPDAEG